LKTATAKGTRVWKALESLQALAGYDSLPLKLVWGVLGVFITVSPVFAQTAVPVQPPAAQRAWNLLHEGAAGKSSEHRAAAVRALSLLLGEHRAVALAMKALGDARPEVRTAAASSLGELRATSAIPSLKEALSDKNLTVALAAAHSLIVLKDTASAYEVYYAILTGDRKGGGLVSEQMETLKDPKKMALLGFREGIGYVPFGDIGYMAWRAITKDSRAPVRAGAVKALSDDADPITQNMLAQEAVSDKSELVRIAALESIAKHGDPSAVEKIEPAMNDPKYSVKCAAAAAILHLEDMRKRKTKRRK